jgi:hypothetical protein
VPKDKANIEAIANGEERPYLSLNWYELLDVAKQDWDELTTLFAVFSEARQRVTRNPASKATKVIESVEPRLNDLVKNMFPPDPEGEPGVDGLGPVNWPQVGLLRHMGYTVGQDDPGEARRRAILRRVFHGPIPSVNDPAYMSEWGRDASAKRLHKLAWSIASFCVQRLRRNNGKEDNATHLWKHDLQWLKNEFYIGYFGFPWPTLQYR